MPVRSGVPISDERGATLVELMVGLAAGMVVLAALSMLLIATMHGTDRVAARVEATQRARLVVAQVMEELHSACIAPQISPIFSESNGTKLAFVHAGSGSSSAVSPTPVKSVITLKAGALSQSDYATTGGTSPSWTWATTASSTRQLMSNIAPISPSSSIFKYYKYSSGSLVEIPVGEKLGEESLSTIQVQMALNAAPTQTPIADAGADASIRDSAVLRLTPPSFEQAASAFPCQ